MKRALPCILSLFAMACMLEQVEASCSGPDGKSTEHLRALKNYADAIAVVQLQKTEFKCEGVFGCLFRADERKDYSVSIVKNIKRISGESLDRTKLYSKSGAIFDSDSTWLVFSKKVSGKLWINDCDFYKITTFSDYAVEIKALEEMSTEN